MKNILFVCTGNTCRSPMAAAIMNKLAIENDLDIRIESAGLFTEDGLPASDNAIKAMDETGIDLTGHRTKAISKDLLDLSDIILTMTEGHKTVLTGAGVKDKVFTLKEYAGGDGDISDPYGGDLEEYRETAKEIYSALIKISEKLPIQKRDDN